MMYKYRSVFLLLPMLVLAAIIYWSLSVKPPTLQTYIGLSVAGLINLALYLVACRNRKKPAGKY
jgi:hypothetical protein